MEEVFDEMGILSMWEQGMEKVKLEKSKIYSTCSKAVNRQFSGICNQAALTLPVCFTGAQAEKKRIFFYLVLDKK